MRRPSHRDQPGRMPGGGPQSAVDGEDEAGELPARRHPILSRGQVPGGGPQSAVDGEDDSEAHHMVGLNFQGPSPLESKSVSECHAAYAQPIDSDRAGPAAVITRPQTVQI
jgi:hypothetical protein